MMLGYIPFADYIYYGTATKEVKKFLDQNSSKTGSFLSNHTFFDRVNVGDSFGWDLILLIYRNIIKKNVGTDGYYEIQRICHQSEPTEFIVSHISHEILDSDTYYIQIFTK